MTKHEIRETAFILLYQLEQSGFELSEISECTAEAFDIPVNKAALSLAEKVWEKRSELDATIGKYSPTRAVERISKVNLSIIRIAVYELTYEKEQVPPKVAINEAIELTKAYGMGNDRAFVNGVLNSYYKDIEN